MKKQIILLSTLFSLLCSSVYADYYYDMGSYIGSSIGSAMGQAAAEREWRKGTVNCKTNINKNFDLKKLKRFFVGIEVIGDNRFIQQDKYFSDFHIKRLVDSLRDKYFVSSMTEIWDKVAKTYPEKSDIFAKKLTEELMTYDAYISINVYTFYIDSHGFNNVYYDIKVQSHGTQVFSYMESRYNVPYKSGYILFEEICEKFKHQFDKYFKNSTKAKIRTRLNYED